MMPVPDPWRAFLASRGATWEDGTIRHFGSPDVEREAAASGAFVCDLSPLRTMAVEGPDSAPFLQGQLTSDVRQLTVGAVQLSAYCTPKGRMLAAFPLLREGPERFLALLPRTIVEPVRKRLSLYVLRAKTALADVSPQWIRLGVGGPKAREALETVLAAAPEPGHSIRVGESTVVGLPGGPFVLLVSPEGAPGLWDRLAAVARPAGFEVWEWLLVAAGIGSIVAPTQDLLIPQSINWDLVGGVSFSKGCYPGQEIVARTRYLGRLKERLYLLHLQGSAPPAPGTRLYSPVFGDQAAGTVVASARAPGGGCDLLAALQTAAGDARAVRVAAADGPAADIRALPYPVPRPERGSTEPPPPV